MSRSGINLGLVSMARPQLGGHKSRAGGERSREVDRRP